MRAIPLVVVFVLGALVMIPPAIPAQEKKDEKGDKKDPQDKKSYDEVVTVRQKIGAKFLRPTENVPAYRREIKGKQVFVTRPQADDGESPKGSEITDKDGVVWVVTSVTKGSGYFLNYTEKRPVEKKP